MRPIFQSRVGEDGTCLSACVASILECSEADVGDLLEGCDSDSSVHWLNHANERLAQRHGVTLAYTTVAPAGYSVGTGPSIRIPELEHAVVCLDGVIVHDPSPRGPDLVEPTAYLALVTAAASTTLREAA